MSYDIYFVRRDPGQSFEDALESTEDSYPSGDPGPLTSVELEQWERIVPHARAILGDIEEFTGDANRELSHPATGLQLSILPGEISITVPELPDGVDAVGLMEKVYALANAVETETGLEGYDPQLGEPIRDVSPPLGSIKAVPPKTADDDGFFSGERLTPEEFQAEQQPVMPRRRRRWWEFWKS